LACGVVNGGWQEPSETERFSGDRFPGNSVGVSVRGARVAIFLTAVGGLALLPLYGDSRPQNAVSHPEWARMVLRGLDLLVEAPGVYDTARDAFATLSGRESRAWPASAYVHGTRVETSGEEGRRVVEPTGGIGEAVYAMGIARPGDYRLRLDLESPTPAEAELTKAGTDQVLRSFPVAAAPVPGWIEAGVVHLDPGAYDATVLLPPGSRLQYVELAPPCVHPIEPLGGWKADAITTTEDVAVTVLRALDLESELPPAAPPIELHGTDLKREDGTPAVPASAGGDESFHAGTKGGHVLLLADLPQDGLYTLSVFGTPGRGQRWTADACRKCVVCPSTDPLLRWRVILSGEFQKGPHVFAAALGPGAVVQRLRLERKKDAPSDYVGAVERLGLQLGPPGPVTREKAEEARRFLERRRAQREIELCGDVLPPGTLVAEIATPGTAGTGGGGGGAGGGGGQGGGGGAGGGGGGGGAVTPPPIIPPLPPASGTVPDAFSGGGN
jgi:hypothetical protein